MLTAVLTALLVVALTFPAGCQRQGDPDQLLLQEVRARADLGNGQLELGAFLEAERTLADIFSDVPHDYAEAAEQGDAAAQFNLGILYANGQGVPEDHAEAMRWFRLAAEQGDAEAQYKLGVLYADGRSVPQDYAQAARWFRAATATGAPPTERGFFGPTTEDEAGTFGSDVRRFPLLDGQQGWVAEAQFNLGFMYSWGLARYPRRDGEVRRSSGCPLFQVSAGETADRMFDRRSSPAAILSHSLS